MIQQANTRSLPEARAAGLARRSSLKRFIWGGIGVIALAVVGTGSFFAAYPQRAPASLDRTIEDWTGQNPHPIKLLLPRDRPLSALAQLGEHIFNDPALSASGRQSCASCHSPDHSYGPPDGRSVELGGPTMTSEGIRTPPTLGYLYRQDPFGIGPTAAENDAPPPLDQLAQQAQGSAHVAKTAGGSAAAAAAALVPRGGLFWDGRSDTLMDQAGGPMTNPAEMANKNMYDVAAKLARAPYRDQFKPLFGAQILNNPAMLFVEAMSALSAYQIESPSFHRFSSKYDYWLEGKARFSPAEMRGLRLFNDPSKGNCAGCHLSQPSPDGLPPLFTDTEYEALGVPRNRTLQANRDPNFHDMGICGPLRTDMAKQTQYCGMFLTPTLRNTAKRGVYFHNGIYHTLKQVLEFYDYRDVQPGRIYPRDAHGKIVKYNDLPVRYQANIDTADQPFDRKIGDKPALTDAEMDDIIAFIGTLSDGYRPSHL